MSPGAMTLPLHSKENPDETLARRHHEQMLKLVAGSFYREMINYGVAGPDVLSVAGHLLDNVMQFSSLPGADTGTHRHLFSIADVDDEWDGSRRLKLGEISITPFEEVAISRVLSWLQLPLMRDAFHPPFPDTPPALASHLRDGHREYFLVSHGGNPVGVIGAESIDRESAKVEMRKLIGEPTMQGKGIGKRATFLFLYHMFLIRGFEKIYVHSMDTNIRNLNLNRKFGFELEGVFFQDVVINHKRRDVVRMALLRSVWLNLFSVGGTVDGRDRVQAG